MNTTVVSANQPTPTILVTGATGNIGSELSKLLAQRGIAFRAMVRNPNQDWIQFRIFATPLSIRSRRWLRPIPFHPAPCNFAFSSS
ncbi:hypothetical protein F5984_24000 [Rudanella paleaurantiibacter]|uniref:NmrA-like domain-containing protein n=2 Tax=Rudanella paleaurantiibacter TaxID=2614655 RepID=A0A7J5TT36_9BACT|nr:hypothetical protein F5984_24000 [Rudanella paleaurantiibacter]